MKLLHSMAAMSCRNTSDCRKVAYFSIKSMLASALGEKRCDETCINFGVLFFGYTALSLVNSLRLSCHQGEIFKFRSSHTTLILDPFRRWKPPTFLALLSFSSWFYNTFFFHHLQKLYWRGKEVQVKVTLLQIISYWHSLQTIVCAVRGLTFSVMFVVK